MGIGRTYDMGYSEEVSAVVAELRLTERNVIAQISEIPADEEGGEGFLLRVWPPNGTAEHGGTNMTAFSLSFRFDETGAMKPMSMNYDPEAYRYNQRKLP